MPRVLRYSFHKGTAFAISADGNPPPSYLPEKDLEEHLKTEKYLPLFGLMLPGGAVITRTGIHPTGPSIWALCDESQPKEMRFFLLAPTGRELPECVMDGIPLDSLQLIEQTPNGQKLVIEHVFEIPASSVKQYTAA